MLDHCPPALAPSSSMFVRDIRALFLALLCLGAAGTDCPPYNTSARLLPSRRIPDPFQFLTSSSKVTTKEDWQCRRLELAALYQDVELGALPPKPSVVNAAFAARKLNISAEENGKRITFTVTINLPNNASTADGPFPAIIAYGGPTIPLNGTGIATILYNNDQMASQVSSSTRGQGLFFDLYGRQHSAGALIAWTWGVSRILDALEILGSEITGIDPDRVGLNGCSRHGKAVLVAGAFEERIALTVAQEGGVGGPACWYTYDQFAQCKGHCIPIEPSNPWDMPVYRKEFPQNIRNQFNILPYDNHELIGMHAPRGLLILENNIDWLQPIGSTLCGKAGRTVYEALGAKEAYGFSLTGGHNHCALPGTQQGVVAQYLAKYLLGRDDGGGGVFESIFEANITEYQWGWMTPALG